MGIVCRWSYGYCLCIGRYNVCGSQGGTLWTRMGEHSVFLIVEILVLAQVDEKTKDNEDCVEK